MNIDEIIYQFLLQKKSDKKYGMNLIINKNSETVATKKYLATLQDIENDDFTIY